MNVSIEKYENGLCFFVSGAIKDDIDCGCVGFYLSDGGKSHIAFSKGGRIRINEFPKELVTAADRFNEIVNTYFENES